MLIENKIIKINLKENIIKNLNDLYFVPYHNNIYYNDNHLNYIYRFKNENIEYVFYGFFKNDYFVIILDIYNEQLDVIIESKKVYLIKLEWELKQINDDVSLWILNYSKLNNIKTDCLILSCRKKLFSENYDINDILKISDYHVLKIKIKIVDEIKKKYNLSNLLSLLRL
jgi:hypothetical protein